MARKKGSSRKYGKKASSEVRTEMRHYKQKKHGSRVKSRKQAIAIGLSEARRSGGKVPKRPARKRTVRKRAGAKRSSTSRGRRKMARRSS